MLALSIILNLSYYWNEILNEYANIMIGNDYFKIIKEIKSKYKNKFFSNNIVFQKIIISNNNYKKNISRRILLNNWVKFILHNWRIWGILVILPIMQYEFY